MCFKCRTNEEIIKSIKSPIHLANLHASAVYRSIVDGVKPKKTIPRNGA